jgi:hypothetical protein
MKFYIVVRKCLATECQNVAGVFDTLESAQAHVEKSLEVDGYDYGYRVSTMDIIDTVELD